MVNGIMWHTSLLELAILEKEIVFPYQIINHVNIMVTWWTINYTCSGNMLNIPIVFINITEFVVCVSF